MKKLLPIFSFFILCFSFVNAQSWQPVGGGLNYQGYVNTLFVYDSVMYAGGYFTSPGNNIAQWNNTTWSSLSSGINNRVYAIGLYKDTIYVGGWFSEAGGHSASCLAKWDGKGFSGLPFSIEGGNNYNYGQVNVIHQYDSLLFIGGNFDSINHKHLSGLVTWDGKMTDSLNTYYGGSLGNLSTLCTYNNTLLLGLFFTGNGSSIVTWNNTTINYLSNDYFYEASSKGYPYSNAFWVVDTNIYMGGYFSHFIHHPKHGKPDTIYLNNIAMWNGTIWDKLGSGINGIVNALTVYNNLIIAAGSFDSAGGVPANNIAAWNGTTWSALGNGVNGTVNTLAVFDSNLYAGGDFTSPGNGIAVFKAPIAHLVNSDSINVFPNPNNGQFTVVCYTLSNPGPQPLIEIYNILGEKIYSATLVVQNTTINLENQPDGVYIYKIFTATGNLINPGKLVKE